MNVQMMTTYIMIDVLSITMAVTMGVYVNSNFGNEFEVKTLRKTLFCFIGFLVCGLIWLLTLHEYIRYNIALAWISNMCSLIFMTVMTFYWCVFALSKLSIKHTFPSKRQYLALVIPLLIGIGMCISSPFTGWIFTITDSGEYLHGPLFLYISGIQYIYDILVCVQSVRNWFREKDSDRKKLCLAIGSFIIFPMIGGLIQLFVAETPILAPSIMVALFLVFINIQNSQIYNDALTGLNNKKKLFSFLDDLQESGNGECTIIIYMLDVNSFKKINDTYGHVEGDDALRIISNCLEDMASQYGIFIAKFGGDEFTMIDYRNTKNDPEKLIDAFNMKINEKFKDKPYAISIATGYAEVSRNNMQAEEAIDMADKRLYEVKKKYHSKMKRANA